VARGVVILADGLRPDALTAIRWPALVSLSAAYARAAAAFAVAARLLL
jgi:hypothetical protein